MDYKQYLSVLTCDCCVISALLITGMRVQKEREKSLVLLNLLLFIRYYIIFNKVIKKPHQKFCFLKEIIKKLLVWKKKHIAESVKEKDRKGKVVSQLFPFFF